jgi:Na+/melibiose symporter-like transporter
VGLTGFQWPKDAPTSAFSLFSAGGIICMIIGIGFSRRLAERYGKRDVFGGALLLSTMCLLAFALYSPQSVGLVILSYMLHGFFYGITTPLLWAMVADVADYSEWKNHRRATAIVFSAILCGLKAGLSIGGALVAQILSTYGYARRGLVVPLQDRQARRDTHRARTGRAPRASRCSLNFQPSTNSRYVRRS